MLQDKKILLGITGSIAAYKSILLLRLLVKAGAKVKVVMTPAAKEFVSPLVLSVLSDNKVVIEWEEKAEWNNHVQLGRWADLIVLAPLSCNTLSKMAIGACDNLLLGIYLSATCPVLVAPAMDNEMWHHPSIQKNIETIRGYGVTVLNVNSGELASGLVGEGRMAEPEDICNYIIEKYFRLNTLAGRTVLVTAGPTYEPIDPVRFIGNHSSGKMGFEIAEACYLQGAEVILVTGPTHVATTYKGIQVHKVSTANEMYEACVTHQSADCIIMSAAVADYRPQKMADQKIKKTEQDLTIQLAANIDILKYLGEHKPDGQLLVGFALETDNELNNAKKKLDRKNLDLIVLNSLNDKGAGFGYDTNKATLIDREGSVDLPLQSKKELSLQIVQWVANKMNRK